MAFNKAEVLYSGEQYALLRPHLLESAVARPKNLFFYENVDDFVTLAVSIIISIARNHPFEQANKRTAFDMGMLLLELNGLRLIEDNIDVADDIVRVITTEMSELEFENRIRILIA